MAVTLCGQADLPTYLGERALAGVLNWEQFDVPIGTRSVIVTNTHASGSLMVSATILDAVVFSAAFPRHYVTIPAGESRAISITSGQALGSSARRFVSLYSATASLVAGFQVQEIA